MKKLLCATIAASAVATLLATAPAFAREGNSSSSVGHGIKCRNVTQVQPDGTRRVVQVCSKGV